VTGESLFDRLGTSGPSVDGEASEAAALLESTEGTETESLSLLLYDVDLSSPELQATLEATAADLAAIDGVTEVVNPLAIPPLPEE
jgi:RND superfamily putative drug exporter